MNLFKKILSLIMCLLMLSSLMVLSFAEEVEDESGDIEIVLLFDVSGSMNESDPVNKVGTRMSIEAAYQFVFNYPSEKNMFITVIPYHSCVYTELDKVNVSTPVGYDKYCEYMQNILDNTLPKSDDPEISPSYNICWKFQTDIGGALAESEKILDGSTESAKKAVILFTDGEAQLETADRTNASKEQAKTVANSLKEKNIPLYCIGLNYNGSVNREFLYELAGEENTEIVESSTDLSAVFGRVYTYLVPGSYYVGTPGGSGDGEDGTGGTDLPEGKPTTLKIPMYGQAVRESNISLSSKVDEKTGNIARINTIKVTTPSGIVVAEVDLRNPKSKTERSELCEVKFSPSRCSATIKLFEPMDGDWEIILTGEEGTILVQKINLFDLKPHSTLTDKVIYVDDVLTYEASIYNSEKNIHLSSPGLYSADNGASAMVEIVGTRVELYTGKLNTAGSGYDFSLSFSEPGEYTLDTIISHAEFSLSDKKTVTVIGPEMSIAAESTTVQGDVVDLTVNFKHPVTNDAIKAIPKYLSGTVVNIRAYKDGALASEASFNVDDMVDGAYNCAFKLAGLGNYTIDAGISYHGINIASEAIAVESLPSSISKVGDITDKIENKGTNPVWEATLYLSGVFADSDGDDLNYEVSVNGDAPFAAKISGTTVTVSASDFGEGVLTILVSDASGAKYAHEIALVNTSIVPMIITICIIVAVLIVAAVVFALIVRKKKIISFKFKVKIEPAGEAYSVQKAVYSVSSLASKRTAKPTMALSTILAPRGFGVLEEVKGMTEDELHAFIATHCKNITLTGVPFKRAIKIVYTDPAKKKSRKYEFSNSIISIKLLGDAGTIYIARGNATFD